MAGVTTTTATEATTTTATEANGVAEAQRARWRRVIELQWASACAEAEARGGGLLVYEDQKAKAREICAAFAEGVPLVTLVAAPQWGKTGTAMYAMYLQTCGGVGECGAGLGGGTDPEKVFLISGMSDTDWREQTRLRMLPYFRDRVFHRNDMRRMREALRGARDALVILDECQFATTKDQTVERELREAGLLNYEWLREANVKILCISATPVHMLLDATAWGPEGHRTVIAATGPTYLSFAEMLAEGRLRSRAVIQSAADVVGVINEVWGTERPRYHILRILRTGSDADRLLDPAAFREAGMDVSVHNAVERIADVQAMLSTAPRRHHVLFIKGFWRASKTMDDRYVGVCYESGKDAVATAQGLPGRMVGHGKQSGALAPIVYCDIAAIETYQRWLDCGCDYRACENYASRTVKVAGGVVKRSAKSAVHPDGVSGLPGREDDDADAARGGAATPAPEVGPVKLIGVRHKVPVRTFVATRVEVYKTRAAFLAAAGVSGGVPGGPEWPEKASDLRQLLATSARAEMRTTNISFTEVSGRTTSNLMNYFKDATKTWCRAPVQVIWMPKRNPEEVTVIYKDWEGLNGAVEAARRGEADASKYLLFHKHLGQPVIYEITAVA
jgi:hypothetical protein